MSIYCIYKFIVSTIGINLQNVLQSLIGEYFTSKSMPGLCVNLLSYESRFISHHLTILIYFSYEDPFISCRDISTTGSKYFSEFNSALIATFHLT